MVWPRVCWFTHLYLQQISVLWRFLLQISQNSLYFSSVLSWISCTSLAVTCGSLVKFSVELSLNWLKAMTGAIWLPNVLVSESHLIVLKYSRQWVMARCPGLSLHQILC